MRKILIANRGEIAVRITRTCHELGIKAVAVFSEVDRSSPHVLMASEAYPIGPAPSTESYLNVEKLLEVAKISGADAIHPGYGFLSENNDFARKVMDAGFIWIGPPPDAMAKMGDKVSARKLATDAGVPVVPGSETPISTKRRALELIRSMGLPVLIKAVGGGGGKGMRIVRSYRQLPRAIDRARSEARSAFSDGRLFMEKYLTNPRHIEIQVVADARGNCLALTERDCSIQRRYQKLIEESPSLFIHRNRWEEMAECARKIAVQSGYAGVGTVEFLVDSERNFYFLEMNTRLQVEHPVTEMITGIDLVREQIQVAAGKELSVKPGESEPRGHAIECRVYAEDGFSNFIPSTGTIVELDLPGGFGIRFDHGMRAGQQITPHYDPLLGKLVAWGEDRNQAIRRMQRALKECHIVGVQTTVPFCFAVLSHPRFLSGDYTTGFVSEEMAGLREENTKYEGTHRDIASVLSAIHASYLESKTTANGKAGRLESRWKISGRKDALR